jgi:uncharacterized protein (TIGR04222 family)
VEHPWGIFGPVFLVMYCVGLVLAFGWALRVRYRVRRPAAPAPGQQLGVAELAFLAGGPRRVIEAAIARLVETGQIHAARNGELTAASTASSDDRVQAEVLRQVGRSSTAESVEPNVSKSAAVVAIGDQLVEQRLLVAPAQAMSARRRALLWPCAVGAVGLLGYVSGMNQGGPGGFLLVLLLLTAWLVYQLYKRKIKARTVHGDRVLASIRKKDGNEPDRWLDPAVAVAGVGGAVALGGLRAVPDDDVRLALMMSAPGTMTASSLDGSLSWWYADGDSYSSIYRLSSGSRSDKSSSGSGSGCGGDSSGGCGG